MISTSQNAPFLGLEGPFLASTLSDGTASHGVHRRPVEAPPGPKGGHRAPLWGSGVPEFLAHLRNPL